jgi:NTE family protein
MLFHLGALWRLNDAGLLARLERISSVSAGSIVAGVLAMNWRRLAFDARGVAGAFAAEVAAPVRRLASMTIDASAIIGGVLTPEVTIAAEIERHYRDALFGAATLRELPDRPDFVFNATSLQTGALWRFSKSSMGDYRVGLVRRPDVALAAVVAASSAFPPVLSPFRLDVSRFRFDRKAPPDMARGSFRKSVVLTDGGVYDNMGLESVWKAFETVLVSDAGARIAPQSDPHEDWLRQLYRVLEVTDNQVRSLRARQVVGSFRLPVADPGHRAGALWTIRTDISAYRLRETLPCPFAKTTRLAHVPTRLAALAPTNERRLVNWGFAVADAALRAHYDRSIPAAREFPYAGGVG